VSKDNTGTTYSPANVPYRPASLLKISLAGVKEGDFTFIMGYPGSTNRTYTVSELQADIEQTKQRIDNYKEIIGFLEKAGENDRAIQIKYAALLKAMNNGYKNRVAKLEGFRKQSVPAKKKALEEKFLRWAGGQPDRKEKYGDILTGIERFMAQNAGFYLKKQQLDDLVDRRSVLSSWPRPTWFTAPSKNFKNPISNGKQLPAKRPGRY